MRNLDGTEIKRCRDCEFFKYNGISAHHHECDLDPNILIDCDESHERIHQDCPYRKETGE